MTTRVPGAFSLIAFSSIAVALAAPAAAQSAAHHPPKTDAAMIANAMSAAPARDFARRDNHCHGRGEDADPAEGEERLHLYARRPEFAGQRSNVP